MGPSWDQVAPKSKNVDISLVLIGFLRHQVGTKSSPARSWGTKWEPSGHQMGIKWDQVGTMWGPSGTKWGPSGTECGSDGTKWGPKRKNVDFSLVLKGKMGDQVGTKLGPKAKMLIFH